MPVEKTERDVRTLVEQISRGEIKLPEIQRGYVWKPTQIARLVSSLYRGWPTGSLLMWRTGEDPALRSISVGGEVASTGVAPLYLLDGQQRLTSLHRVFNRHDDAQIAFNVESEDFQNHSAATRKDPRWVTVWDVVGAGVQVYPMIQKVIATVGDRVDANDVGERLSRLASIGGHQFRLEVLHEFSYEDVTKIFVTVNSGGRPLRTADLALATLSAHWPGVTGKLDDEAAHWAAQGYRDLDANFLTRALTGAVLGRGLSAWSHSRLVQKTHAELDTAWATVRRGLRHLVPLLRTRLGIDTSSIMPSHNVLIPLVVLLGERPDVAVTDDEVRGVLYFVLAATFRARYSGAVDTTLGQDIPAAREPDPTRALLANVGLDHRPLTIGPNDLAGRTTGSPSFFLSYLVSRQLGAQDWWSGATVARGGRADGTAIEFHHVHPQATLRDRYSKSQINDLANLAFVSERANKKISSRSPRSYFPDLSGADMTAHLLPTDDTLRDADRYLAFIDARRQLLAAAMQEFVDGFRPSWLQGASAPTGTETWLADLVILTAPDTSRTLRITIDGPRTWRGLLDFDDLVAALDAASDGLASDVRLGPDHLAAVTVVEENIELAIGPLLLTGTKDEWDTVVERELRTGEDIETRPDVASDPGEVGPLTRFPIRQTS